MMNHPVNPPGPQHPQGPGQPQWQGQPGAVPQHGYAPQGPGYPPQGPVMAAPKKKSKAPIIVAAVVALALLAGGAFAAVMLFKKPASVAAANVLPDNPLIVASIDLNPSAPDQLAVKDLAEKFPEFTDGLNITEGNYKKALAEFVLKNNDDLSWTDVEPWLGDSITVAAYPQDSDKDPMVILAIQHKDAGKAEAFAKDLAAKPENDDLSYRIADDQLLITKQAELPDADAVKKAPLANNEGFKADMAKLPGGLLATFWGDVKGLQELTQQLGGGLGATVTAPTTVLQGRIAFGLRIEDSTLVLEGIGWQEQKFEGSRESVSELIGNMPSDTIATFGASTNDAAVDQAWEQLDQQGLSQSQLQSVGISSKEDLKALIGQQFGFYVPQSALTSLTGRPAGAPTVGLAVKTNDPAGHQAVLERIGKQLPEGLKHHSEGDKVYTIWNGSAEELAKPKEKLASNEIYQKVVKEADKASAIFFINIDSIVTAVPNITAGSDAQALTRLGGVGMVAKVLDDHYSSVSIRLSFK
ncbi:MAG: DUF3352 domain-containing protein [Propionibacteriaceae bacterium]|nr:DUF3352 domain-containing protein [Propionibacteriaceae bacterium]